jgi:hypothetical protein
MSAGTAAHDVNHRDGQFQIFPGGFQTRPYKKGGSTTYEFSEVKHNVEINDTLFVMPGE